MQKQHSTEQKARDCVVYSSPPAKFSTVDRGNCRLRQCTCSGHSRDRGQFSVNRFAAPLRGTASAHWPSAPPGMAFSTRPGSLDPVIRRSRLKSSPRRTEAGNLLSARPRAESPYATAVATP